MPEFYERRIGDKTYRISYGLRPFDMIWLNHISDDEFLQLIKSKKPSYCLSVIKGFNNRMK